MCQILWSWSYRQLQAASHGERQMPSTRATGTHNQGVFTLPAPQVEILFLNYFYSLEFTT